MSIQAISKSYRRRSLSDFRPPHLLQFFVAALILATPGNSQRSPAQNVGPLIHALESRDLGRIRKILDAGINLNAADEYGQTPLGTAIAVNLPSLALEMIQKGADVNLTSIGWTPLMGAAFSCEEAVVLVLLDRGAAVNWSSRDGGTALIEASDRCKAGRIIHILLKAGASVNAVGKFGNTALMIAVRSGNESAVQEFITAGADLNLANADGETALSAARDHPFREEIHDRIYAMLLKAGAR
jgi:ankyrin repeat protein